MPLKQLQAGTSVPPLSTDDTDYTTWVVFEVSRPASMLNLREVTRVQAGSAETAVISAGEVGKVRVNGQEVIALPLELVATRRVRVSVIVSLD